MSPFYGDQEPGRDSAADWLYGGDRKRRIVETLAASRDDAGLPVRDITTGAGCTRVTAFETLRGLKAIGAVDQPARGRYRLRREHPIGVALARLADATRALGDVPVDRPPRPRGRR